MHMYINVEVINIVTRVTRSILFQIIIKVSCTATAVLY